MQSLILDLAFRVLRKQISVVYMSFCFGGADVRAEVMETNSRVSHMLSKCPITELHKVVLLNFRYFWIFTKIITQSTLVIF